MTWLTWRQFRAPAVAAAIGLAAVGILLAATPHGAALSCADQSGCGNTFLGLSHDHLLKYLSTFLVGLPALVGAFWGAPLVARELEAGTHRLAWTQGVTRRRWLAVKVTAIGLSAALVCGLMSLMLGSWSSDEVNSGRLSPAMFAERGIVPIGYAVFAVALGVVAGVVIRRTVAAMAVTIVGFLATRIATQFVLRPHLLPSSRAALPIHGLDFSQTHGVTTVAAPAIDIPGGWELSRRIADDGGHAPAAAFVNRVCGHLLPPGGAGANRRLVDPRTPLPHSIHDCVGQVAARFHEVVTYQPASHYWGLQWAETGVFVALALALLGFSFWWVRHRLG